MTQKPAAAAPAPLANDAVLAALVGCCIGIVSAAGKLLTAGSQFRKVRSTLRAAGGRHF
jgi:hypothetical protein